MQKIIAFIGRHNFAPELELLLSFIAYPYVCEGDLLPLAFLRKESIY